MIFTKFDAVASLRKGCSFGLNANDEIEWYENTQQCPTDEEISTELTRLQSEYDAKDYQRKRAQAYPSFADQFDLLYHGGYDAWKAAIDAVKQEYPK